VILGNTVAQASADGIRIERSYANSITGNHPDVYLIVLLIDERPTTVRHQRFVAFARRLVSQINVQQVAD
jgi:transcription termination factor Rho